LLKLFRHGVYRYIEVVYQNVDPRTEFEMNRHT
jgi:hypothetical protein